MMYPLALLFAAAVLAGSLTALRHDDNRRNSTCADFFRTTLTILYAGDTEPETIHVILVQAVIGRQERYCDYHIPFENRRVSRLHAILWYEDGTFHIRPYRPSTLRSDWEAWYTVYRHARFLSNPVPAFLCRLNDRIVRRIDRIEEKFHRKSAPQLYAHAERVPQSGMAVPDGGLDVMLSDRVTIRLNTVSRKENLS